MGNILKIRVHAENTHNTIMGGTVIMPQQLGL
jgi:hypothetical protein